MLVRLILYLHSFIRQEFKLCDISRKKEKLHTTKIFKKNEWLVSCIVKKRNDDLLIADFLVWPPSLDWSVWDWFFDLSGVKISSIDGFKTWNIVSNMSAQCTYRYDQLYWDYPGDNGMHQCSTSGQHTMPFEYTDLEVKMIHIVEVVTFWWRG